MTQSPIIGVFGRRGCGKSTLGRKVLRHQARLVVWDYMSEHGKLAFRSDGDLDSLADYLDWARGQRFAAARYVPESGDMAEFEEFCDLIFEYRNLLVVVEEAAAICSASHLSPAFGRIVRQGRHHGLGLLWTTQRLNEVSRTLTGLTDVWAGFSLSEPNDLLALGQRCGRAYADKIAALPRFAWLGYEVDSQQTFKDADKLKSLWGAPKTWNFNSVSLDSANTGSNKHPQRKVQHRNLFW